MNYRRIYNQLIERARARIPPEGYIERHHVIPRCIGGDNSCENLVALTPEEHFVAHVLLVKMYPEHDGLILAANKMCRGRKGKLKIKHRKMYGWLKRKFSELQSRKQAGEGNSQFGTRWVNNGTKSFKLKNDEPTPDGCVEGRIRNWNMPKGVPKTKIRPIKQKKQKPTVIFPKVYGPYIGKDGYGRWIVYYGKSCRKTYTTKQYGTLAQLEEAIGLSPNQ